MIPSNNSKVCGYYFAINEESMKRTVGFSQTVWKETTTADFKYLQNCAPTWNIYKVYGRLIIDDDPSHSNEGDTMFIEIESYTLFK